MDYDNQSYAVPGGSRPRRKRLGIVLSIFTIILLGSGIYLLLSGPTPVPLVPVPVTPEKEASLYKAAQHYCSVAGNAVLCQDVRTGKTSKHKLPKHLSAVNAVVPSPDGSKFLVRTAANPMYINESDHLYVTDQKFEHPQELPADEKTAYSSFAWVDANTTLALARRTTESGKTAFSFYDTGTKKAKPVGSETANAATLYPSAAGDFVFIEERTADKPKLSAIEVKSSKVQAIATDALLENMKAYATVGYDNTANTFYISGSGKASGQPVLAIAKVTADDKNLRFKIQRVIDDTYAYVLLQATAQGMLVTRQKQGEAETYGTLKADGNGSFQPIRLKPTATGQFGLDKPLALPTFKSASLAASDFLYTLRDTPPALETFLRQLVGQASQPACPAGAFNHVRLLAQDGTQAAVRFVACGTEPAETRYYTARSGTYEQIGKTFGTPTCEEVTTFGLSDAVAPSCQAL